MTGRGLRKWIWCKGERDGGDKGHLHVSGLGRREWVYGEGKFVFRQVELQVHFGCPVPYLSAGISHYFTTRTYCIVVALFAPSPLSPCTFLWEGLWFPLTLWKSSPPTCSCSASFPSDPHTASIISALTGDTSSRVNTPSVLKIFNNWFENADYRFFILFGIFQIC